MPDNAPEEHDDSFISWPPSPKLQILLIGAALFLFNALLIVIWAFVFTRNF